MQYERTLYDITPAYPKLLSDYISGRCVYAGRVSSSMLAFAISSQYIHIYIYIYIYAIPRYDYERRHAFRKKFQYDGETRAARYFCNAARQCASAPRVLRGNCPANSGRLAQQSTPISRDNSITGSGALLTVQVVKDGEGRAIWPGVGLRGQTFNVDHCFQHVCDRATPKLSNVGDFRVDCARLKFSAYVRGGTPPLRLRYFQSRDNDPCRETGARFSETPFMFFFIRKLRREIYLRKKYTLEVRCVKLDNIFTELS